MKKIYIILSVILFCIGCSNTSTKKEIISQDKAYNIINNMFGYEEVSEEYSVEYYQIVEYEVDGRKKDYYAFLVTSKKDNYDYYVLVDTYGEGVISPVPIEDITKDN